VDYQARQNDSVRFGVPVQREARTPAATCSAGVSVLLVDDTLDLLRLLRMLFDFHDGVEVLAEAHDGLEALQLWRVHRPAVVVMDLRMPVMSGLEAAAQMLAEDPGQRIVMFSAAFRQVDYQLADAIGVTRCLDKRDFERLPELVASLALTAHQV
jgi:CheY-like chemotaxis protein